VRADDLFLWQDDGVVMAIKSFVFKFADVEAHERDFRLIKAGEVLPVEPKAFRVLLFLLRNPQKLITKEELLNAVWGDAAVTENSLTRAIALLRRLLGDDAREPRFIQTITSIGYRWLCPVTIEENLEVNSSAVGPTNGPSKHSAMAASNDDSKKGKRLLVWLLSISAVTIFLSGVGIWYLRRPLPPARIAAYTRITYDGHTKWLTGTDGSRLYFTQHSPNAIKQVAVTGGEVFDLPIAIPEDDVDLYDISAALRKPPSRQTEIRSLAARTKEMLLRSVVMGLAFVS
jgi:DNA-binding winged helix-turn-helix (wHTH) protein